MLEHANTVPIMIDSRRWVGLYVTCHMARAVSRVRGFLLWQWPACKKGCSSAPGMEWEGAKAAEGLLGERVCFTRSKKAGYGEESEGERSQSSAQSSPPPPQEPSGLLHLPKPVKERAPSSSQHQWNQYLHRRALMMRMPKPQLPIGVAAPRVQFPENFIFVRH